MTSKTKQLAHRLPRPHATVMPSALVLLTLTTIATLFFVPRASAEEIFDRFSYWSLTAMLGIGLYFILTRLPNLEAVKDFSRTHRPSLAIAFGATLILALSVPQEFRDIIGETNLLSLSNSLLRVHAPRISQAATFSFDNFNPLVTEHSSEPILFSYLTHLFHLARGVKAENAFLANLAVWFGMVFIVAGFAIKKSSATLGILATLALLGQPLLALQATSAGPELLFVLLFGLSLYEIQRFLVEPTQMNLARTWLLLVLLATSHAEALLISPALYASLFLLGRITKETRSLYGFGALLAAVLLYPFLCQQLMAPPPLALSNLWPNTKSLAAALFDFRVESTFSKVLTAAGVCAVVVNLKRRSEFLLLASLAVFFQLFLVLCQKDSAATDAVSAGHFLPLAALLAISPATLVRPLRLRHLAPLVLANFLWYHPFSVDGKVDQTLVKNRELRGVRQFLKAQNVANVALISETPSVYAAFDYGAFSFDYAQANDYYLQTLLKRRYLAKIYVLQTVDSRTQEIPPAQKVSPRFKLTPVKEVLLTETQIVKISELSETP